MQEIFWADKIAKRIIERNPDKKKYFVEGGIAPSARKHIGSVREIATGYLVKLALEILGKKVRFAYSWDAYDRLKKISASIPEDKRKELEKFIGTPQGLIPDPFGCHESYAEHFEKILEEEVARLGISPEFLYQDKLYRKGIYADPIKEVMLKKDIIIKVLNKYHREKLPEDWWPIRVYCEECGNGDDTEILGYDGGYTIKYKCKRCSKEFTTNFKKNGIVKPTWRVDWAMRWHYYDVDFEPSGKDHMVAGSSYDTSSEIVRGVFGTEPPYAIIYEFVGKRGEKGKMSASKGNIVTLTEVLDIYPPEIVRYFFAGTKPAKPFSIPFDDEIFKVYEDFYKVERIYFEKEENVSERDKKHWSRVYEFANLLKPPEKMSIEIGFRELATFASIFKENAFDKINERHKLTPQDAKRVKKYLELASNWINKYAPEEYKIRLIEGPVDINSKQKKALKELAKELDSRMGEKEIYDKFFEVCKKLNLNIGMFFKGAYLAILGKERGPRLAELIIAISIDKVKKRFEEI